MRRKNDSSHFFNLDVLYSKRVIKQEWRVKMKIKTSLAAAIISVVAIPAFANFGHSESQAEQLTEGVTPSGILTTGGFADEYVLSLNESSEVKIASEHFPGSSSFTLHHMKAKLMDASGNIVSEANAVNGVFKIDERLDAGEYRLIVSGRAGGHGEDDTHQYRLHVDIQ